MRLRDTATILRGTAAGAAYAGETGEVDWTTPTEHDVNCVILPNNSVEVGGDRPDFVDADFVGVFYRDVDLTSADRIRWREFVMTVNGVVAPAANLRGSDHHYEVPLKLVT